MSFRKKQPQALGRLLDDFVESYPHRVSLKRGMILSLWPRVIGKAITEQVHNLKFQGSRLVLFVDDPSWRHEIHMQRHMIAKKLNKAVNEEIIRDIIVKT
ncbi:DUF721 domain-containing protein [Balneolaceae bacterium ANBcel3]|nr:DUF721 domain-containing protein [Balneolaceae bacterium ANBcel3]